MSRYATSGGGSHGGRRPWLFCPAVTVSSPSRRDTRTAARVPGQIVGCGGAGIIRPGFDVGHVIVPIGAVRDEGTSYHYLPASREVAPTTDALEAIVATLEAHGVPHVTGKTWTTDGIYRETRDKVRRRVAEGCLTVEMEAAAFFAVAQFRGVSFGQMLYAGDDLSGEAWDGRGWPHHSTGRDLLLRLAAEAVLRIEPTD